MSLKLGPLQEQWLQYLEQHPEQQGKDKLGTIKPGGEMKMCCLGVAGLISGGAYWRNSVLKSGGLNGDMELNTYDRMGLIDACGSVDLEAISFNNINGILQKEITLAAANDEGMSWPEIAAAIRANPKNFFTKSV